MTAPNPEPIVLTSDPSQQHGQFLVNKWPDGTHTVAWRAASWETWSPAVEVKPVPVFRAVP